MGDSEDESKMRRRRQLIDNPWKNSNLGYFDPTAVTAPSTPARTGGPAVYPVGTAASEWGWFHALSVMVKRRMDPRTLTSGLREGQELRNPDGKAELRSGGLQFKDQKQ